MTLETCKMELLELAKQGTSKVYNALKKFFLDSKIINEIYDVIDKDLFLAATQDERYRHIADIKENDIFDQFVELCASNASFNIDIDEFVEEHYNNKSNAARDYIKWFFGEIA